METLYNKIIMNQMEAALCTLAQCFTNCPESEWDESHGDYPFSQVVFHALFFTDYYLERDESAFKNQIFHRENKAFFKDYEELEYRQPQNLYERQKCGEYLKFCVNKCKTTLKLDNQETLEGPSGFSSKPFCRAELYVHLIRHIQHHAAQLGLRIQKITGTELKWIRSGWDNDF